MKILIAVPTFESIYPDTYKAIYDLDPNGNELQFEYVRGYDCATARNKIAQTALDKGVDYVLMVDNDVILPKDAIANLTDDLKEVCLGYYAHRDTDNIYRGRTCVCKTGYYNYPLESEFTAKELHELRESGTHKLVIHGGGMGCAFIKADLFNKLEYPWYDWINYADARRGMLSEDLFFCERCRMAEVPIYTDTRVGCGHILRRIQWPE